MTRTMLSSSSSIAPQRAGSPVIVALDYADARQARAFADKVAQQQCRLKIGKEMFTLAGPALVRDLQQRGGGAGGLDGQRSLQRRRTYNDGGAGGAGAV